MVMLHYVATLLVTTIVHRHNFATSMYLTREEGMGELEHIGVDYSVLLRFLIKRFGHG